MSISHLSLLDTHTYRVYTHTASHTKYTGPGRPVTNLAAEEVDPLTVSVTWTVPSPSPPYGCQVLVPTENITRIVRDTSLDVMLPRGNHSIQVRAVYNHYPSYYVSTHVTVRGKRRH